MQNAVHVKAPYRTFIALCILIFTCTSVNGQNPNRDHADFPPSVIKYYLPSGRDGLAETSFRVSGRVFIHRWENSTSIEVFIHWTCGTSRTLDPGFKYDYVFQGVHYGDQHLGKEAFDGVKAEGGNVKFNVVIMFRSQIIHFESEFAAGSNVGKGPVDLEASEVKVFIKGITNVGFNGKAQIEEKILALREANKKKEYYTKFIKEADQFLNQKNWTNAIDKYESASRLLPNETYPTSQLKKISEYRKKEEEENQITAKKETYAKNIKEADAYMAQKNWESATLRYKAAIEILPNELYPSSQLKKIEELKRSEALKSQQTSNTSSTNASKTTSAVGTNTSNSVRQSSINSSGSKTSSNANQGTTSAYNQANANLPQFGRDNAGNYYEKDANNNYQKISLEQYQQGKNNALKQKQDQAQAVVDAKNAQIVKDAQAKAQAYEDGLFKNMNTNSVSEAEKIANQQQSFYAAESVSDARSAVDRNSRLNGNYTSVQQIEAEFNQKYNAISADVNNLKNAKNDKLQADYKSAFYGSDQKGQAIGQLAVGIGSLINEASAAREARKAREALEEQRRVEIAKIEERKRQLRIELRNKLFTQFPDGGLPLSSHNIFVNEVYFFSYMFDKSSLDKENAVVYLTNLFPIAKYGDGSWPFKTSIVSELSKSTTAGPVTIMGYYTTSALAEKMRNTFKSLSEKSGLIVKDVSYKGKQATGSSNSQVDFWGNGVKKKLTNDNDVETISNQKIDFWGNPVNSNKTSTQKQAVSPQTQLVPIETPKSQGSVNQKVDFWGNPIKPSGKDSITKEIPIKKVDTKKEVKVDFWGNPIKQ